MRALKKGRQQEGADIGAIAAELKRLRRDVDQLSLQRKLDELTRRVSRLEFIEENRRS